MTEQDDSLDVSHPDEGVAAAARRTARIVLQRVVGRTFEDQMVYLDGRSFERCTFRRCRLIVEAGHFRLVGNTITECFVEATDGSLAARIVLLDKAFRGDQGGRDPIH